MLVFETTLYFIHKYFWKPEYPGGTRFACIWDKYIFYILIFLKTRISRRDLLCLYLRQDYILYINIYQNKNIPEGTSLLVFDTRIFNTTKIYLRRKYIFDNKKYIWEDNISEGNYIYDDKNIFEKIYFLTIIKTAGKLLFQKNSWVYIHIFSEI